MSTREALRTPKLVAEITNEPRLLYPPQLSLDDPVILLNTTRPAATTGS